MLRALTAGVAKAGYEVQVVTSMPSYRGKSEGPVYRNESVDGVSIWRAPVISTKSKSTLLRLINTLVYCVCLFLNIIFRRPDVVTAATFPPVVAAWTASLAAKVVRAKFVYHMQDIHPEVSKYSGGVLGSGMPFKVLRTLDNQTLRRATAVVVLSQDMANTLNDRGLGPLPIRIINNFSLQAENVQQVAEYDKSEDKIRIIFAGNLGRFQNLQLLSAGIASRFDSYPHLEFMFLGDGELERELKKTWSDHPQVIFAPFVPYEIAKGIMSDADIGVVSLESDIYRVSYPSKMLTYLSLGLPILALVESGSALAGVTTKEGLGEVPDDFTIEAIGEAVDRLVSNRERSDSIESWFKRYADSDIVFEQWFSVMDSLRESKSAAA